MSRTTTAAVEALIESFPSGADVSPFIDTANDLVTEICGGLGYSDTRLELIERWLSAHFYLVSFQPLASQGIGGANDSYSTVIGKQLELTRQGQQVMMLDTQGGFVQLSNRKIRAGIMWLGKTKREVEETDYDSDN